MFQKTHSVYVYISCDTQSLCNDGVMVYSQLHNIIKRLFRKLLRTYTRKIDNRNNLKTCIKVYDVYGHLKDIIIGLNAFFQEFIYV